MRKVTRVTDLVFFPHSYCTHHPPCGAQPIVQGSSQYYINALPNARVTDMIACGGPLITGSESFYDQSHMVSRIGDHGTCPCCGVGTVITGAPKDFET